MKCSHKARCKLIEIPGKDRKMFGTPEYEPDYNKLVAIANKVATGDGDNYHYLEFAYCYDCNVILELNQVFTS